MAKIDDPTADRRLTRVQVEEIIERAIELDDAGEGLSLNDLHRIGTDVGISPHAISQAVNLVLESEDAPAEEVRFGGRRLWSIIAVLVLGVGLVGGLTGLADETFLTLLLLIPTGFALVQHHREKGSVLGFWAHWIGLCAAYFITWVLVTQGLLWQDMGALVGVVAASVAAIGGVAVDQSKRNQLSKGSRELLAKAPSDHVLEGEVEGS